MGFPDPGHARRWRHRSEILEDYPDLVEADIQACIAYGAEMSRDRYVDVPLQPAA
ncbi:MAG: DUF433 domain-containing protein [Verrucomicrobiota bacterium]|nr:DUF433 domain-containing protein [Verrucomicrobiota bacterium]